MLNPYRKVWLVTTALVFVAAACTGRAATQETETPGATPGTRSAQLSELQNDVEAREQAEAGWQTATEGQEVVAGGGVQTGTDARVRLDITDGTIVRLAASTVFSLTELSPAPEDPVTRFKLDAGKMWVSVTKALGGGAFEIETPSGVATVRGSLMSTEFFPADGHMTVTCLDGQCRLAATSGAAVDLAAGQQSDIPGYGEDPGPATPIDSAQLGEWVREFPEAASVVAVITPGPSPTETPTPGPGSGGGVVNPVGQTACDHPYFPLRAGASWTYLTTSSGGTDTWVWTANSVEGDTTSASADMSWSISQIQGAYHWTCDANGLVSYDFGSLSVSNFGQISSYNIVSHEGVFLPPADLLVPGYAWAYSYTFEYEITVPGQSATATTTASDNYTVTGVDSVTLDGQTYDALVISGSSVTDTQIQMVGFDVPPSHSESTTTMILARGVGFVRWNSNGEGGASTTELQSFSIP